jgi:hypothetical protein
MCCLIPSGLTKPVGLTKGSWMPPAKKTAKRVAKRTATKRGPRALSKSHLEALAVGRTETGAVNRYLVAIDRPKTRGRKPDTSRARLAALDGEITDASGAKKLDLVQRKLDLERLAREGSGPAPDMAALERAFVKVARSYSNRKGISYAAWRALGVPAGVLAKAKVGRTRS